MFRYIDLLTSIMENNRADLVGLTNSFNDVTNNLRESTENINQVANNVNETVNHKIFRKFGIPISTFVIGFALSYGLGLLNENTAAPFEKVKSSIERNIDDRHLLLMLEHDFGLYKAESIIEALNRKNSNQELDEDTAEFRTLHHFEEAILNKNNYFYRGKNAIGSSEAILESESQTKSESSKALDSQPEMVALEFADNDIFGNNNAASCNLGSFFNKQVELSNTSNTENNALVNVNYSINCQTIKKSKCVESLERDNVLIQIPFSVAEKIYPELINTKTNYNALPSCSYALAEVVSE